MIRYQPETNPFAAFMQKLQTMETDLSQCKGDVSQLKTKVASYSQLLGDLTAKQAYTLLGIKSSAFYKLLKTVDLVKYYKGQKMVFCLDKVEAYKASLLQEPEVIRITRRKSKRVAA